MSRVHQWDPEICFPPAGATSTSTSTLNAHLFSEKSHGSWISWRALVAFDTFRPILAAGSWNAKLSLTNGEGASVKQPKQNRPGACLLQAKGTSSSEVLTRSPFTPMSPLTPGKPSSPCEEKQEGMNRSLCPLRRQPPDLWAAGLSPVTPAFPIQAMRTLSLGMTNLAASGLVCRSGPSSTEQALARDLLEGQTAWTVSGVILILRFAKAGNCRTKPFIWARDEAGLPSTLAHGCFRPIA